MTCRWGASMLPTFFEVSVLAKQITVYITLNICWCSHLSKTHDSKPLAFTTCEFLVIMACLYKISLNCTMQSHTKSSLLPLWASEELIRNFSFFSSIFRMNSLSSGRGGTWKMWMVTTIKKSTLLQQQRRGLRCRPEAPLPSHNAMMLSSQVTISVSLPSNLPGEWFHPPLEIPPRTRGARVLECAPPCSLAIRKDFHSGSTNKIASSILKMSSTSS